MIHIIHFTATKVGGACSHLGSIGSKVGGALAPLALWLPRPWIFMTITLVSNCYKLFHLWACRTQSAFCELHKRCDGCTHKSLFCWLTSGVGLCLRTVVVFNLACIDSGKCHSIHICKRRHSYKLHHHLAQIKISSHYSWCRAQQPLGLCRIKGEDAMCAAGPGTAVFWARNLRKVEHYTVRNKQLLKLM